MPVSRIVCFGEILLRLAARPPAILGQEGLLETTYCGAEANVAVALSGFGHDARMASVLPTGRLGDAAIGALRTFGVETGPVARVAGRMGLYFLSPGAMSRPSEIIYDRAGSAFARLSPDLFDWPRLLDGADWLFVGGISAALGDGPLTALRAAVATARQLGVKIAFDCNYRPSLWQGREDQAKAILCALACDADLLFAGRRAIGLVLDMSFADADPDRGFTRAAQAIFAQSPHLRWVAATRRDIHASDRQALTPLLATRDGMHRGNTLSLEAIVDRIGTGDAFAAGILHGLASGMPLVDCAPFAGACAQWAHGVSGDFLRATLADIQTLLAGENSDVRR